MKIHNLTIRTGSFSIFFYFLLLSPNSEGNIHICRIAHLYDNACLLLSALVNCDHWCIVRILGYYLNRISPHAPLSLYDFVMAFSIIFPVDSFIDGFNDYKRVSQRGSFFNRFLEIWWRYRQCLTTLVWRKILVTKMRFRDIMIWNPVAIYFFNCYLNCDVPIAYKEEVVAPLNIIKFL